MRPVQIYRGKDSPAHARAGFRRRPRKIHLHPRGLRNDLLLSGPGSDTPPLRAVPKRYDLRSYLRRPRKNTLHLQGHPHVPDHRLRRRLPLLHVRPRVRHPPRPRRQTHLHRLPGLGGPLPAQTLPHPRLPGDPGRLPRLRPCRRLRPGPHLELSPAQRQQLHLLDPSKLSEDAQPGTAHALVRAGAGPGHRDRDGHGGEEPLRRHL
mmetsp:Transcript_11935/g.26153  ORF Transcript_11935/g.26153 Transcript_11935/m.26153 type:complete len:207 (+) Transcript_11935:640-1260(+)